MSHPTSVNDWPDKNIPNINQELHTVYEVITELNCWDKFRQKPTEQLIKSLENHHRIMDMERELFIHTLAIMNFIAVYSWKEYCEHFTKLENMENQNIKLYKACKEGTIEEVKECIENGANDFNRGLMIALFENQKETVKFMATQNVTNLNEALHEACFMEDEDYINLFIDQGANDLDNCLYIVCSKGNKYLAEHFMYLLVTNYQAGLIGACVGNHKHLIDLMIEKGADGWNDALYTCCKLNKTELCSFFIEKGATKCIECNNQKHSELLHKE